MFTIDIGNNFIKIAQWNEKDIEIEYRLSDLGSIEDIFKSSTISLAICSAVSGKQDDYQYLQRKFENIKFYLVDSATTLPIQNLYQSPHSLGIDRLMAVVGANHIFPDSHILVIDAGTCITFDYINSKNEYIGGAISPGIHMRYQALHQFTKGLPLLNGIEKFSLIGTDTKSCIQSGVVNGALAEIKQTIEAYRYQTSPLKVIFSGGDAKYISQQIDGDDYFCNQQLVHYGLAKIASHNHWKL
jgi:type III pantothenate kinase